MNFREWESRGGGGVSVGRASRSANDVFLSKYVWLEFWVRREYDTSATSMQHSDITMQSGTTFVALRYPMAWNPRNPQIIMVYKYAM